MSAVHFCSRLVEQSGRVYGKLLEFFNGADGRGLSGENVPFSRKGRTSFFRIPAFMNKFITEILDPFRGSLGILTDVGCPFFYWR